MLVSTRQSSLARVLLATTALSGALGVTATTAQAADECGAPVNGVVTCAASGSPYGEISYVDQTNLKVNLDPGVEAGGLSLIGIGAMELDAGEGVAISASGTNVTAVRVASLEGSAKVAVDTVAVTGGQVYGVLATANQAVNLTARTVTASGREAFGIQAYSTHGDVDVKVGTVEVTSNHASAVTIGISTQARGGKSVNIEVDSVVARATMVSPNGTAGITVDAATRATIKANNVEAYGRAAKGVVFYGTSNDDGVVAADVGRVVVDGENAAGLMFGASTDRGYFDTISAIVDEIQVGATGIGVRIYGGASSASAEWANDLDIGLITGLGSGVEADVDAGGSLRIRTETIDVGGTGIRVVAGDSRTLIDSGSIETSDDNAPGIHVYDTENVAVDAVSITTAGYQSHGMLIDGVGAATLKTGTISTTGEAAVGVWVLDTDQIVVDLGDISTTGDGSHGAVLRGNTVTGRMDSIVTRGVNANGLMLGSMLGATVEVGSIQTYGSNSAGLKAAIGSLSTSLAPAAMPLLTLDVGSVRTEGESATAVILYSDGSEIAGHIETIETTGNFSDAYYLGQEAAAITDMTLGSVTTHGDESSGLNFWIAGGELSVATRMTTTHGDDAYGAFLEMLDGSADIAFDTVGTAGRGAHGILVTGSQGAALVRANSVTTAGYGANGVILAGEDAMRMTAELGSVTTTGDNANAVTTSWDGSGGSSEAVTVKAGVLTTSGANANGVYLYAQDLTLDIDRIVTTGAGSMGAFLTNHGGDAEITTLRGRIGAIDTSGQGAGGLVVQYTGRFDLEVGATHTRGDDSNGITIFAAGSSEAGGKLVAGSVLTEGYESVGVDLYSEYGGYDVAVQSIETRGEYSIGLDLRGGDTSSIQLGTVRTSGEHADGVYASLYGLDANLSVTADDIRTTGVSAYGLRVQAEADVTLNLGYVDVTGLDSDAVVGESGGALTLTATRRLGSTSGVAADLRGDSIDVTLASTAVVEGGSGGLMLSSSNGSTITNGGSISSVNGYAIEAEAGAVTLNNSGLVSGRVRFSSADDVVNNAGRFTADGDSVFGAGDDVFNNTGVIHLAAGVTGAEFLGLERLNNAGIIDLTNSVAGDVFTLDGVVNGQTGGRIGLDLDLRGAAPVADRIVAGGFMGLNEVVLTLQGRASLGDTGVVIAQSAMAQTGQEMTVRVAGGGFVGFDLAFADGEYRISGELAPPAFEPTKVATGAQHQWTSGADVVSARFDQMRDEGGRADGRGDQVWAQVYGGSNDIEAKRSFDLMGESTDADLSHEVKSQGVQAGVDRAVPVEDGSLVFGMLAGAGKTELRFQNGDVTEYDGLGVGAYGHWFSGPLSIGVLAKLDTFKLDYDWAEANLKTRSNGFTVGARVDAAWRIAMGPAWYVEPQASLSWSDTALGRMKARDGAEVVFGDTTSVVGRIGVRAGAEMAVGDGLSFKPYAAVHALNEFEGDNASTLLLAEQAVGVTDRAHGAWGRAVLGASLDAPSGLGGFIQAEGDFGEVEGFTARVGVKFSW